jgi:hypothetical protein
MVGGVTTTATSNAETQRSAETAEKKRDFSIVIHSHPVLRDRMFVSVFSAVSALLCVYALDFLFES